MNFPVALSILLSIFAACAYAEEKETPLKWVRVTDAGRGNGKMAAGTCSRGAVAAALCVALAPGPAVVFAGQGEGNRGSAYAVPRKAQGKAGAPQVRPAYDNGFRDGQRQGEVDAHGNRPADFAGNDLYRSANRGYDKALGTRDAYRSEFQRGFEAGYRQGYGSVRVVRDDRRDDRGDERQQRWARG